jgi:hypothetical protein
LDVVHLPFSIRMPAPALGFRNPGATSLSFRARRQCTVEAAARFPELDSAGRDGANPHRAGVKSFVELAVAQATGKRPSLMSPSRYSATITSQITL